MMVSTLAAVIAILINAVNVVNGADYTASVLRYFGNGTMILQQVNGTTRTSPVLTLPMTNYVVRINGTELVDPLPSEMVLDAQGRVRRKYTGTGVASRFEGIANKPISGVILQEIKTSYVRAVADTINKTACDLGVCDNCMYQFNSPFLNCTGVANIPVGLRSDYCFYKFMQCLKRFEGNSLLKCDVNRHHTAVTTGCTSFQSRRDKCIADYGTITRSAAFDFAGSLMATANKLVPLILNNCWYHISAIPTLQQLRSWNMTYDLFFSQLNDLQTSGPDKTFFRSFVGAGTTPPQSIVANCAANVLTAARATQLSASPCNSTFLVCPACPGSDIACGQQRCQLGPNVTAFNFDKPYVSPAFQLNVSCACVRATTRLSVAKLASGFVRYDWPALFACEHSVGFKVDGTGSANERYGSDYDCGATHTSETRYSLASIPPGTVKTYSLNAAVAKIGNLVEEVATLSTTYYVPFDTFVTAQVTTKGMAGISNRIVTFQIEFTSAQRSVLPWNINARTIEFYPNGATLPILKTFATNISQDVPTNTQGFATLRIFLPTLNATAASLAGLTQVFVRATPAATQNSVALAYQDCATPCSRTATVPHGRSDGDPARIGATFVDTTTVTLRGRFAFANSPSCYANDLYIEAFDAQNNKVSNSSTDETGAFGIVVLQNQPVTLRVARSMAPDYYYVNPSGSAVVKAEVSVDGKTADFTLSTMPFVLATRSGASYSLTSVRVPIIGGLCELPLANALTVSNFKWSTPSCGDGKPFAVTVTTQPDQRAILIANVPPLLFSDLSFDLGTSGDQSAAQSLFRTSYAQQTLDARLPALERTLRDKPANYSTSHLESLLFDSLLLALPLTKDTRDRSQYAHAAGPTRDVQFSFENDNAMVIAANSSALAFGRNDRLDVGGAMTLSMWIDVRSLLAVPGQTQTRAPLFTVASATVQNDKFDVAVQGNPTGTSFTIVVALGSTTVATAANVPYSVRTHLVVTVSPMLGAAIYINGVSAGTGTASAFGVRSIICSAAFQYDCVRETTLFGNSSVDAAQFSGRVSNVAIWSRILTIADITLLLTTGRENVPLDVLLPAGVNVFPRYVYRSDVQLDLPASEHRYIDPPGDPDAPRDQTLDQLLQGTPASIHQCQTNEGNAGVMQRKIHKVKSQGAVVVRANLWENYNNQQCFRVQGTIKMRSTFTGACLPAVADRNNTNILPCESTLGIGAYGYAYFYGVIGPAILIPRDPTRTDGGARRVFNTYKFDDLKPFLGQFQFRFTSVQNSAEQSFFYHVSGFKGPDFPSVYSLPTSDIPILRLYRPPGDESSAFLERSWARSVRIGFSREKGEMQKTTAAVEGRFTTGVEITSCIGSGVGVGFGAIVLGFTSFCTDNKASAFVKAKLDTEEEFSQSDSYSLSEAFSSDVLTRFETAVNDRTVGKWGDIVVTVGITILITDSYFNTLDTTGSCAIDQQYAPSWKPGDEGVIDSLQVTPRISVKPIIDDWSTQVEVINRDCNGRLPGPLMSVYPSTLKALNFSSCTQLNSDGRRVPVAGANLDELVKKFQQASAGVIRWTAILQNWEAVFCAALKAAGVPDYYADDETPACSLVDSNGTEVAKPQIWNVLGANNNPTFNMALAAAEATGVIDALQSKTSAVGKFCTMSQNQQDNKFSLGVRVNSVVDCSKSAPTSYSPVQPMSGVYKLALTGPASFTYATTAAVTRTESYKLTSASQWSLVAEGGGGSDFKIGPVTTEFEISVGAGGGGSSSMEMEGEIETADTTAVGFTLAEKDVGDSIAVSIFADPVYGTPVFVTTGGWTRCPNEPGTNAREWFLTFPVTPTEEDAIELVSQDPDAEIELDLSVIIESQRAIDSGVEFIYDIQVYNDDDLTVKYKGELLGIDSRVPVQFTNTDYTKFGPITVKRGKRFAYNAVNIAMVSECDDGVASLKGIINGIYYNLRWQPKCAVIEVDASTVGTAPAGSLFLSERPFFVINSQTAATAVVRVRNPLPMEAPWSLIDNSFTMRLQYRAVGEQSQWADVPGGKWSTVQFCKNEAKAGAPPSCYAQCSTPGNEKCCQGLGAVCDATRTCCGGVALECRLGVCQYQANEVNATVSFDASALQVQEGQYELRAVSACAGGLQTESEVVQGRIDRVAPRLFGAFQEPADKLWWPGDEISMRFTEDVQCDRPFRFTTAISVGGVEKAVSNAIDIICDKDKIEVAFSRLLISAPDDLIGKEVTLRLANVPDLALNPIASVGEWSFTVGKFDELEATVSITDVRVPLSLVGGAADPSAAIAKALLGDSAGAAQIVARAPSVSTVAPATPSPSTSTKRATNEEKKRQVGTNEATTAVTIEVKSAKSVSGGMSAVRIANSILKSDKADSSNSNVVISAPGNPGGMIIAPPDGEEGIGAFFMTPGGYAVIAVLALVGLLLIIGLIVLIVCLTRRRSSDSSSTIKSTANNNNNNNSNSTEMTPPMPMRQRSRSRRSRRFDQAQGANASLLPPSNNNNSSQYGPAPTMPSQSPYYDQQQGSGSYTQQQPPRTMSRRSASGRRISSRRRTRSRRAPPNAPPPTYGGNQMAPPPSFQPPTASYYPQQH